MQRPINSLLNWLRPESLDWPIESSDGTALLKEGEVAMMFRYGT